MKKIKVLLLGMLIVFSMIVPVNAEGDTIKVGYIDYEGFITKSEDGKYSGYGIDYLNDIAKYTNWNYEYIYDSFSNQMENLKTGKIDLICHAQKTAEREKDYIFSTYSSGSESSILYTRDDDTRYYFDDYAHFDGMKIGLLSDSFQNGEFAKYASSNHFTYSVEYYKTQDECFSALKNKEVDGVVAGSLATVKGYKVVARIGNDPFYFISNKSNTELMEKLDKALLEINSGNPYYNAELYNKYYKSSGAYSSALFTREEAEYIASLKSVNVGLIPYYSPMSYVDENNELAGMTYDLMELVSKKSGIKFEYTFLESGQTGFDYLAQEGHDVVAGVMSSPFSFINTKLLVSQTILNDNISFVGKSGRLFTTNSELIVAIPETFIHGPETITSVYPSFKVETYKDSIECLKAIRDGKADVALQNMYVARSDLQSPQFEGLEIYPGYEFDEQMKVVAYPDHELLMTIINKSINCINEDEVNDIVIANTVAKSYHATLDDFLYRYRIPVIGLGFSIVAIGALLVVIVILKQKNVQKLEAAKEIVEDTNEQLKIAISEADQASQAKSSFLANMSHEIRTPMNAIVGLTHLSRNHLNEPEVINEYIAKIETSSNLLLNIINDILDMSSIESGNMKIAHDATNLADIINSINTIYVPQCADKGIKFKIDTQGISNARVLSDPLRINQVLLNLISNAYKFTPKGGTIKVIVEESYSKNNTSIYTFVVSDTGEGMSEEMLHRLFKPFEQEDASTARKHGGSGLGLSITKQIIELMNGQISVTSKKGEGSTFKVSLPLEIDQQIYQEVDSVSTLNVLVVDDDKVSNDYLSSILDRLKVNHESIDNSKTALDEILKHGQYDLYFVDWKMPDMDGIELSKKIKDTYPESHVILISAYDFGSIEDKLEEGVVDHYIQKPIFQSTIFDTLIKYAKKTSLQVDDQNYDFTGHKLLLAEDNELNAEIAIELLELVSMSVDHAANGEEAVSLFKEHHNEYDLILMDVQMPIKDGYEATHDIRKLDIDNAKSIPIFALTANAFAADISAAIDAGMNGHISKPIDTDVMYKTIAKVINEKK